MTVFFVQLDSLLNVLKVLVTDAAEEIHTIQFPKPYETKDGWRCWLKAETEKEARENAPGEVERSDSIKRQKRKMITDMNVKRRRQLAEDERVQIISLLKEGKSHQKVSDITGVSRVRVTRVSQSETFEVNAKTHAMVLRLLDRGDSQRAISRGTDVSEYIVAKIARGV